MTITIVKHRSVAICTELVWHPNGEMVFCGRPSIGRHRCKRHTPKRERPVSLDPSGVTIVQNRSVAICTALVPHPEGGEAYCARRAHARGLCKPHEKQAVLGEPFRPVRRKDVMRRTPGVPPEYKVSMATVVKVWRALTDNPTATHADLQSLVPRSRMTIHSALRFLADHGFIERSKMTRDRRVASRVIRKAPQRKKAA